uniref:glucan endo-1,3-beta-D-glucosidase n=1 Tax=Salix viminalis TaxID=40686 RepID=A0A6N2KGF0_SALVM
MGISRSKYYNSATFNRNVIKSSLQNRNRNPADPVGSYQHHLSLYNENQKPGPGTERHFGLFYPNGTKIYEVDFSGDTPLSGYKKPLPAPTNNEPYKGKIWCLVAKAVNKTAVGDALSYACSQGNKTCDAIQPGKECYKPESLFWHASYAFSSYWAQFKKSVGPALQRLATMTPKDPSFGHCKFPAVTL